uniref:Uncharacterized protein n=1 Tax=Anguilla anguilla TaxID=7936 RepID=A0A0E9TTB3_ANGAN
MLNFTVLPCNSAWIHNKGSHTHHRKIN